MTCLFCLVETSSMSFLLLFICRHLCPKWPCLLAQVIKPYGLALMVNIIYGRLKEKFRFTFLKIITLAFVKYFLPGCSAYLLDIIICWFTCLRVQPPPPCGEPFEGCGLPSSGPSWFRLADWLRELLPLCVNKILARSKINSKFNLRFPWKPGECNPFFLCLLTVLFSSTPWLNVLDGLLKSHYFFFF